MSKSNDGKYLEDLTEDWFKKQNRIDMACDRLPDTRSARNIIKAQNADFFISSVKTGGFYFECKSVGGKKKILRHFRQFPLMHRWAMAGVPGLVLIHYHELGVIKIVDVRKLGEMKGKQWDLENHVGVFTTTGNSKEDIQSVIECLMVGWGSLMKEMP